MKSKQILDPTCGGRSIWHPDNKDREDTLYLDNREEPPEFAQEGRNYAVQPDKVQDFRDLPYEDNSFNLIVFDPPHEVTENGMKKLTGIIHKKYGSLHAETWRKDLQKGFKELFRVLSPGGTLVFKFADNHIDFQEVLNQAPRSPLFGTTTKRKENETRWFVFYKPEEEVKQ